MRAVLVQLSCCPAYKTRGHGATRDACLATVTMATSHSRRIPPSYSRPVTTSNTGDPYNLQRVWPTGCCRGVLGHEGSWHPVADVVKTWWVCGRSYKVQRVCHQCVLPHASRVKYQIQRRTDSVASPAHRGLGGKVERDLSGDLGDGSPQRGPGAEPRLGSGGQSPPEAEAFSLNYMIILTFFYHEKDKSAACW